MQLREDLQLQTAIRALSEVEVGLEFDPENQEALDARARLRQALTGAGRAR